ncbi:MAG: hypothetical protein ACRC1M_08410 [Methanobacteriaceae archaeon]
MDKRNKYIMIGIIITILIIVAGILVVTLTGSKGTGTLEDIGLVKSEYTLKFFSDGSQAKSIKSNVNTYRTNPYLKDDIDNETVKWIESFDNNEYIYVIGDNANFIIKRSDYDNLKSKINTSELNSGFSPIEYFKVNIKANMIETHSLGGSYKDVFYIDKIDFVNSVKETT